ncbi:hypothetical protein F5884DRAFT_754056 [Xylogone sp. PMI_703]|nr:hypothetical protein F5884DRAFT_754056 [Xylogone sp. PMI_703]
MAISTFLNPLDEAMIEEDLQQDPEDVLREVIAEHLQIEGDNNDDDDDIEPIRPSYTIQAAKEALKVLIAFTESRDDLKTEHLRSIERYEQELEHLDHSNRVQSTLDSWIT